MALLGPRQVGKTTLALEVAKSRPSVYLDLQSDADLAKLSDPELYLSQHAGGEWIMDGPFPIDTHVGISRQLATIRGIELGDQVRIERSGGEQYALFTVDEIRDLDAALDPSVIEMGETGRLRLGLAPDTPETCAHLVTKIAPMPPEFVEETILASQQLVVLAPHGGQIEPGTDTQAQVLVEALAEHDPSLWVCSGEHEGGGSFRIWHIPSTEISVDSFPLLADVATHDYDWAVSFHGMSAEGECVAAEQSQLPALDDPDALALILVGGLADPEVLEAVRKAILDAFDPSEFESEGGALVVSVPAVTPSKWNTVEAGWYSTRSPASRTWKARSVSS